MRISKLIASILIAAITTSLGQVVSAMRPDVNGEWTIPLRYWSHSFPFDDREGLVFLTEVVSLGPKASMSSAHKAGPPRFQKGQLRVVEILRPSVQKVPALAKVRSLQVEGADGLNVGDRVLVFVCDELYEGSYVINYHKGGCILGIRLPSAQGASGDKREKPFLDVLRKDKVDLQQFDAEEIRAWRHFDEEGVNAALAREPGKKRVE